jgi:hypothetical protein
MTDLSASWTPDQVRGDDRGGANTALQLAAMQDGTSFSPTVQVQPLHARLAYLMLAELGA